MRNDTQELTEAILRFNDLPTTDARKSKNKKLFSRIADEFLKKEDNENYYSQLLEGLIDQGGPRHDDMLHFYIRAFLGYSIPRGHDRVCRHHKAPFSFISDMFFERVRNAIGFANRTGGKTLNLAILNHLDMLFKPGCEIVSAGAVLTQADKMCGYFKEFHSSNEFLGELFAREPTKTLFVYKNESQLQVISGTEKGVRGPHPHKARFDEVEEMDWGVLQAGMSMAMSGESVSTGHTITAQTVYTSTRQRESGPMQQLLDQAKLEKDVVGGMRTYCWCVWEVLERCTHQCKGDPYWGDCPIKQVCGQRARKCVGYYKVEDFILDKVLRLDRETLNVEWFNKRPSGSVFVYGGYWNERFHIIPPFEPGDERDFIIASAIDFGTSPGHDFVYQKYYLDVTDFRSEAENTPLGEAIRAKITYYLFYEYRTGGRTIEEHASRIKSSPGYSPGEIIFADPSAKQERIDLEETHGIPTLGAETSKEAGISTLRAHLQTYKDGEGNRKAHFYVFDNYFDCDSVELIDTTREFELYKYKVTKQGKPNPKEPLDMYNHGMDCARYIVQSSISYFRELFAPVFEDIEGDGWWG